MAGNKRPNILFIMADQFRTRSLTGMGDGIETPNIDRIRRQAMFFRQAACTAPLCTPSRASLATGKMPHRCGVVVHDAVLPLDEVTYYQLLRKAGYRVAVAGKTDLHKRDAYVGRDMPLPIMYHYGFTDPFEVEGKMNCAFITRDERNQIVAQGPYQCYLAQHDPKKLLDLNNDYIDYLKHKPKYYAAPSVLDAEEFLDAFIGRASCDFLEKVNDDAPWHFFASFAGPHNPWDPPKEELDRLGDKQYPPTPADDLEGKPDWIKKRAAKQSKGITDELLGNTKRHYDGAIQVIDRYVGKMLDILERRGLTDNTIVIFSADHGEMMGEHRLFEKRTMYEGALRVPLLIHCPGMTGATESDCLASLIDVAPTILDFAKADYNKNEMDAVSLLPVLQGNNKPLRPVQQSELINTMMLYDGRYKWIRNYNDTDELYDLQNDPDELHNIMDQSPDIIRSFRKYTFQG